MKPIGPLMREHRLIEKMVNILLAQLGQADSTQKVNPHLLTVAVDFFRTYADRTHHGKEENIFFRELAKKQLQPEHQNVMQELVQEHILGRKLVAELAEAHELYSQSGSKFLSQVLKPMNELVKLYPEHIKKEDERFFYPSLDYLTREEQDAMLEEFWEFDRKLIHEKYQKIVEEALTLQDSG